MAGLKISIRAPSRLAPLARRLADEADRRVVPVALTGQGSQILKNARRRQLNALTGLLGRLGEDELRALEAGLRGLARAGALPGPASSVEGGLTAGPEDSAAPGCPLPSPQRLAAQQRLKQDSSPPGQVARIAAGCA